MGLSLEEAAQRVHLAGLRMTRPREVLLELVLSSNGPFSVKMLHERAEQAGLSIHLATVHRNLAEFVEVGLVDEMPGEDNRLYALHEGCERGAHIFCLDCKKITALGTSDSESDKALNDAIEQSGFDASSVRVIVSAHCKAKTCHTADHED